MKRGKHWSMFMEHPVDPCMESYIRVVHILGSWGQIVIRTFHIKIMRVWNCTKFCKAKGQNSISTRNKDTCLVWVLKEGFSISEPFELQTSSTSKSCQIFLNVMSSFPSHLPPSWFHSFILVLINLHWSHINFPFQFIYSSQIDWLSQSLLHPCISCSLKTFCNFLFILWRIKNKIL